MSSHMKGPGCFTILELMDSNLCEWFSIARAVAIKTDHYITTVLNIERTNVIQDGSSFKVPGVRL